MKNYSKKLVKQGDVRTALDFLTYTLPSNIGNPERPIVQVYPSLLRISSQLEV